MNSKKARQTLICNECGKKFRPVGVELRCQACMDVDNRKFGEYLDTLSDDEHTRVCDGIMAMGAALGITIGNKAQEQDDAIVDANPEEVPADDQDDIDSAFNELMEGLDL